MKWEIMYNALLEFAKDREETETKDMSTDEKSQWVWDGHVPTNFKTKDGKALGRWVNNQRSAKGKGTLKDEREDRLVAAGLKFTEQRSAGWSLMLNELKYYIESQTKVGRKWDGNVPTGFQIKARPGSNLQGEDRNLGRWVNRQRSMFHAGRLQKDRQLELEGLGLKWSMIQTVSWDTMYDTLVAYVEEQKSSASGAWDGSVPTGYRTPGEPSRALGRWINRQRSACAKNRLKDEYKEKLSSLGLKWSLRDGSQRDSNEAAGYDSEGSEENEGKDGVSNGAVI
jgi:Helicase associated domain